MPPTLPGRKGGRVEQAQALHERAAAGEAKVRNLLVLQVEDAFYRFESARRQVREYTLAVAKAEGVAKEVLARFYENRKIALNDPEGLTKVFPTVQEALEIRTQFTQLQLALNEARFRVLVALADLERVTAGGVCPNFGSPAAPANSSSNGTDKDDQLKPGGSGEAAARP